MTDFAAETVAGTDPPERKEKCGRHVPGEPSMWFFVIGDLFIFGFYFVMYMYHRGQDRELFLSSQSKLNLDIGAINTVVLLTSSLFVALAVSAARTGKPSDASRLLSIAFAFGVAFPVLKMFEWVPEVHAGLTPGTNAFFMYYYVMTGMHLCHVLLGLVIICFMLRQLRISPEPKTTFLETGATYWHMVDILWLVLFAVLYLMR